MTIVVRPLRLKKIQKMIHLFQFLGWFHSNPHKLGTIWFETSISELEQAFLVYNVNCLNTQQLDQLNDSQYFIWQITSFPGATCLFSTKSVQRTNFVDDFDCRQYKIINFPESKHRVDNRRLSFTELEMTEITELKINFNFVGIDVTECSLKWCLY